MNIDNQKDYWNKVAAQKEFTHPLDEQLLKKYFAKENIILDYGCGYGRIVHQLLNRGFKNTTGFDTSSELIKKGNAHLAIYRIDSFHDLPVRNQTLDVVILFALLTCIPSNRGQKNLIQHLYAKLKTGGILYISDYYLQEESPSQETQRYGTLNNDAQNYGVFSLEEGVTFRHHSREWIQELLQDFELTEEKTLEVVTLNKHKAQAFQLIARRQTAD